MNDLLQTIPRKATMLVIAAAGVSVAVADLHFAAGVVLSGLLLVGSFRFGAALLADPEPAADVSAGGAGDAAENAAPSPLSMRVPLLLSLKFPIVGAGTIALLYYFPPLSVLLGGGMLVTAIALDAVFRLIKPQGRAATGEVNGI